MPTYMRGDDRHLYFVSIIILLNDVLEIMLPVGDVELSHDEILSMAEQEH